MAVCFCFALLQILVLGYGFQCKLSELVNSGAVLSSDHSPIYFNDQETLLRNILPTRDRVLGQMLVISPSCKEVKNIMVALKYLDHLAPGQAILGIARNTIGISHLSWTYFSESLKKHILKATVWVPL